MMENNNSFLSRNFYYSRSANKLMSQSEFNESTSNIGNEEYIKEYQSQNIQLNKLLAQRILFLEELKDQEIDIEKKTSDWKNNCAILKQKICYIDSDIINHVQECKELADETTNKQDKLLQDKTNLQKQEAESLQTLNKHKLSLKKTYEKSYNSKRIYDELQKQYSFYQENLTNIDFKYQSLLQEIKNIQDGQILDAQLQQFTQQKQTLNEKLQSIKGNVRVYCRIRPLRQEEKISIIQSEYRKQYDIRMTQLNASSLRLTQMGKSSVQKENIVKGTTSITKEENNPAFQQEMNLYVQQMLEQIKDDDDLLYQMIPQSQIIRTQNAQNLKLTVPFHNLKSENNIKEYTFKLEHIFEEDASQMEVFSNLQELIQSVLDGYNVCIFAYGPTGSGKTYTMQGEEEYDKWGIIPRSIEYIYSEIEKMQHYGWDHKIRIQFSELYNETLIDLLHPNNKKDEVLDREINNGPEEVMKLLQKGYLQRKVASTDCNEYSSRSHSMFRMYVDGYNGQKQGKNQSQPLLKGSLNLVDLAGSEKINQSNVSGERLKETQSINKSLAYLAAVITSLAKKEEYTSYRNSKLTYYLQEYLSGKSKTLMMVNISPSPTSFASTLTTLKYADQAKQCQNKTEPNNTGINKQRSNTPTHLPNKDKLSMSKSFLNTPTRNGRFQNILAQSNLNSAKK